MWMFYVTALIFVCTVPKIILGGCPKECVCRGTGGANVKCPASVDFPESFPANTEKIVIDEFTVTEIPPKAFDNLPNLTSISFSRCNFGQVSACAFPKNHKNLKLIQFDMTVIGEMKQGAFSYLNPVSIVFSKSSITTMRGYSFWNINTALQLSFTQTTVHLIEPYAFYNVNSSLELRYDGGALKTLRSMAFANTRFNSVVLQNISFDKMECHVFPELDRISSLTIAGSQFMCNCDILYMKSALPFSPSLKKLVETGTCKSPEQLKGMAMNDVLVNNKVENCPEVKTQTIQDCRPPQEIPTPACPDRIVMGDGKSNESGSSSSKTKPGGGADNAKLNLALAVIIFVGIII